MSPRRSLWIMPAVIFAVACGDSSSVVQPNSAKIKAPGSANRDSYEFPHSYICAQGLPDTITLYTGNSVTLSHLIGLCDSTTNLPVAWDSHATYFTGSSSIGTIENSGTGATVHGIGDGTTYVGFSDCCDKNNQLMELSPTVLIVSHAPLIPNVSGEGNVNSNRDCNYSAGATGGYPPYTSYSWSVDGTITQGQGTSAVTVNFTTDNTHLVSVLVTDSQGHQAYGNLWVTSSTQDPPELTCNVT